VQVIIVLSPPTGTGSICTIGKELRLPLANQSRAVDQGEEKKVTASTKVLGTSVKCPSDARSRKAPHG
jgi:hypothetical protein